MILEIQNQSLAFLLSLRESLFPTRIRQRCRGIWVGFIPMVLSPIGFSRFSHETFRFLLLSNREFYLSKSKKRFETWIWDPGEHGSDYKEFWIRNRFWSDLTHSFFDEEEISRWPLDLTDRVLVCIGSQAVFVDVLPVRTERVLFNPKYYYKINNRLFIRYIHIVYRRSLVFYHDFILLEILLTNPWWYWKHYSWLQIWVIIQRRLPNDEREPLPKSSKILISTKQQDT